MLRFASQVFRLRWSKTDPKLVGRIHHISEGMPPSVREEVWTNSVSLGLWQDKINKIDHCHNTCCQACLVWSCIVYGINRVAKWKSWLRHLQIHLGGWGLWGVIQKGVRCLGSSTDTDKAVDRPMCERARRYAEKVENWHQNDSWIQESYLS